MTDLLIVFVTMLILMTVTLIVTKIDNDVNN